MTDLVEFIEARLTEDETMAHAAALANPGSAARHWAAAEIDDQSGTTGLWGKAWGIIPDRVRGVVLARTIDIAPKVSAHIARHDPARVLREVEAKRRILARHQPVEVWAGHDHIPPGQLGARMMIFVNCSSCIVNHDPEGKDYDCRHGEVEWPCPEVCDLAAAYADHPDYLTEWSPENVVPPE